MHVVAQRITLVSVRLTVNSCRVISGVRTVRLRRTNWWLSLLGRLISALSSVSHLWIPFATRIVGVQKWLTKVNGTRIAPIDRALMRNIAVLIHMVTPVLRAVHWLLPTTFRGIRHRRYPERKNRKEMVDTVLVTRIILRLGSRGVGSVVVIRLGRLVG